MNTNCHICKENHGYSFVLKAALSSEQVYDVIRCNNCSCAFFDPIPSQEELINHYSNDYIFYKKHNFQAQGRGYYFARKYLRSTTSGNFLDIGCGSGYFLSGVQMGSKWNVIGTDINPDVTNYAKSTLDLDIRTGSIEEVQFEDGFFDFIYVHDVLEHVTDPALFMKECRRIIKDQGLLYLSVPNGMANIAGMLSYYNKYNNPAFSHWGHLFFFSYYGLKLLFESSGFNVHKKYTYNFKDGLRNFSVLPHIKNWKEINTPPYLLKQGGSKKTSSDSEEIGKHQMKRSNLYYKRRFIKDELKKIPGIYKYGNDYIFLLRAT